MKKHFEELNEVLTQIRELSFKLNEIENELYSVKGVGYDFMPKGNSYGDNKILKLSEKDEILKQIQALEMRKKELLEKHLAEIALVRDSRYRSILRSYYLYGMKGAAIANMLNMSVSRFWTLKSEAVEEFTDKVIKNTVASSSKQ